MSKELDAIMRPKSIAIVGATEREGSVGKEITQKLIKYGFKGDLYPVNPKSETIFSNKAYKSILDIPSNVDLAVIVIPSKLVPKVIDQCGEKGIKGVIIITAGFKEAGKDGAILEDEIVAKLKKYEIRAVGPNCLGVLNSEEDIKMNATFAEAIPMTGRTAFVSQSGALGAGFLNISKDVNVGISNFVSIGNKADINGEVLLDYWEDDKNVNLILLYLESILNPQNFRNLSSRISKKKPIIAVKSGRSSAGAKAASSHTGSLAGADLAADALLKQSGVIRANSMLEMFQMAQAFSNCSVPRGNRVAIMTNAGGPGIMATDALCEHGLEIADIQKETKYYLTSFLPEAASVNNPIDMIASAPVEHYKKTLKSLISDENVDIIISIYLPLMGLKPIDVAKAIMEIKEENPEKPILGVFMAEKEFFAELTHVDTNLPFYQYPEEAAFAISKLDYYRKWLAKPEGTKPNFKVDEEKAKSIIKNAVKKGRDQLTTLESIDVLDAYGVRTCKYAFANGVDEAVKKANKIGYPVVMKITSTKISHKTEVGGVIVGINSETELKEEYKGLIERLKERNLKDALDGVIIQEMVKGSREMVCGIATDPQYGPMMMFGLGGIYIETIKDVTFKINPLTDVDAKEMIESVKAYEILKGARGTKPAQMDQIQEIILRLSQLVSTFSFIDELDINPLKISEKTGEGIAVDGRIQVRMKEAKKALGIGSCGCGCKCSK